MPAARGPLYHRRRGRCPEPGQPPLLPRNPSQLAQELALRARRLRAGAASQLAQERRGGPLQGLLRALRATLSPRPSSGQLADAYAQTITFGLLMARWLGHDGRSAGGERLTRTAALELLPPASPLLDDLFRSTLSGEPGGPLLALIDDIVGLLGRVDVAQIFGDGGSGGDESTDPVTHFYEPFLAAYDSDLRSERGVFFTPRPVVSYIVRSAHELLQTELGLEDGLASVDTWGEVASRRPGLAIPDGVGPSEPFVRILDPATGTGTFLFECIDVIERTMKARFCRELGAEDRSDPSVVARWQQYVPRSLLPRLVGVELMMAPHAIAHLKLSLKLRQTGYRLTDTDRLELHLTNTLEPPRAARGRGRSPRQQRRWSGFTVVLGNPPYAGSSANMAEQARRLVDSYKRVDGAALGERKLWLQDDYVKFVRAAQICVEQAGVGVLGFVTNHGYLDNPTFRGMRQSLLGTFGRLCLLDLHGNANKREQAPGGAEDRNVFDIRQGVAVVLGVRGGERQGAVGHAELWGSREAKYRWLSQSSVRSTPWRPLAPSSPFYLFSPSNPDLGAEYERGWPLERIFPVYSAGFITARDHFVVGFERDELLERVARFADPGVPDEAIRKRFFAGRGSDRYPDGDTRSWKVPRARRLVREDERWRERAIECLYRPFDVRFIYWAAWMVDWPRAELMRHLLAPGALALSTSRSVEIDRFEHVFCAGLPIGHHSVAAKEVNHVFPLYLLSGEQGSGRQANLSPAFLEALSRALGRAPSGPCGMPAGVTAEQVFGYVYAVLHCPTFRARYREPLRSSFPRVPLPAPEVFGPLSERGVELVGHHLMRRRYDEGELPGEVGPVRGAVVEQASFSGGTVWVDSARTAGFSGVSDEVFGFRVGGYRICQRWLKDRTARRLSGAEVDHFRRMVAAIGETLRLMRAIDAVVDAHGGIARAFSPAI